MRWKKIALSAAKQLGRAEIPEIQMLGDYGDLIRRPWPCELKLLFWEGASTRSIKKLREERKHLDSILLVIGPEGGFTSEEVAQASDQGFLTIQLGGKSLEDGDRCPGGPFRRPVPLGRHGIENGLAPLAEFL